MYLDRQEFYFSVFNYSRKVMTCIVIMFSCPSSRLKLFIQLINSIDFGISLINFHFSEFEYFAMREKQFVVFLESNQLHMQIDGPQHPPDLEPIYDSAVLK